MSDAATTESHEHHGHEPKFYIRIWAILVGLLVVSVLGPMAEIQILTLITAFGIAVVKAYLVAKNFMHLGIERRYIIYLLITGVAFMLLFFFGTAPDVMRHSGAQWENVASQRVVAGLPADGAEEEWDAASTFASTCSPCHGADGEGDGAAAAALDPHPADFTDPEFWATRDLERIRTVIEDGAQAVGGSPLMPAFGSGFDDEQVAELAEYVQTFAPEEVEEPEDVEEPEGLEDGEGAEGAEDGDGTEDETDAEAPDEPAEAAAP